MDPKVSANPPVSMHLQVQVEDFSSNIHNCSTVPGRAAALPQPILLIFSRFWWFRHRAAPREPRPVWWNSRHPSNNRRDAPLRQNCAYRWFIHWGNWRRGLLQQKWNIFSELNSRQDRWPKCARGLFSKCMQILQEEHGLLQKFLQVFRKVSLLLNFWTLYKVLFTLLEHFNIFFLCDWQCAIGGKKFSIAKCIIDCLMRVLNDEVAIALRTIPFDSRRSVLSVEKRMFSREEKIELRDYLLMLVPGNWVLDHHCELPLIFLQVQQQLEESRQDLVLSSSVEIGKQLVGWVSALLYRFGKSLR